MLESNPLTTQEKAVESVSNYGAVTAPGAGVAIVTIAAPAAGKYKVCAECLFSAGAPAAAEDGNFAIRKAAIVQKRLAVARALNVVATGEVVVEVDGAQAISVNSVGAGTAAVVYSASITASKIG